MSSSKHSQDAFQNRILATLSKREYERLLPHLKSVSLFQGKILYGVGDTVEYAYFPTGGMISLLSITETGKTIEVSMVGSEGMVGIPIILELNITPYEIMVQLPCNAIRIRAEAVKTEFHQGGNLQKQLLLYMHTLLTQVSQSAACNGFHTVEERLCRWLLVGRDCVQSDTLHLTQEFLSHMLGVPRTSVTMIAGNLQRAGLIRYSRGKIRIIDRESLESASCECYRMVKKGIAHYLAA
ncbi:MAG TPA: Crp/Fnr family transcriptional regulator [Pyrinomonadaceae bacterium]|nr:Crp/Fnr family transcriptional regulator [Pyrinomonadaceae bacterium]